MLKHRVIAILSAITLTAVVLAVGTSQGSGSATTKKSKTLTGPIVFAEFRPLTGASAAFAPPHIAGCYAAVTTIIAAGGILGDKNVNCTSVDTRGDPTDAVPAAQKMVTTTRGLVAVDGPTSSEASATVPILNAAHIPMFATTGQSSFDVNHYPYYYRVQPADETVGYAMALYAYRHGYRRAVAVFGTDITASGSENAVTKGFTALGGKIVGTINITEDQTSYNTEAAQLASLHPQVIFTETDPQTAATFFGELRTVNNGSLIPIIGTDGTVQSAYYSGVEGAVGKSTFISAFTGMNEYMPLTGPSFDQWKGALYKAATTYPGVPKPIAPVVTSTFAAGGYDGLLITALAIEEAHSANPVVFNKYIVQIANGVPGAVVVNTFAAGKKALVAGHTIHYVGVIGRIVFNQYHNSAGEYSAIKVTSSGQIRTIQVLTTSAVEALQKRSRAGS